MNDMRLWIPSDRQYTYPDVMLIDGKPVFEGENQTTIINPSVIMEVLSNSTKNYDRGEKFDYYRSLNFKNIFWWSNRSPIFMGLSTRVCKFIIKDANRSGTGAQSCQSF